MRVALMNNQWVELTRAIPALGRYSLRADVQQYVREAFCHREYDEWNPVLSFKYWGKCKQQNGQAYEITLGYKEKIFKLQARKLNSYDYVWPWNCISDLPGTFGFGSTPATAFLFILKKFEYLFSNYTKNSIIEDYLFLTKQGEYELKYPYNGAAEQPIFWLGSSAPQ